MHDAALVGNVNGPGQDLDHSSRDVRIQRRSRQPLVQAAAVHILQSDVRQTSVLAHLVHLHDIGVLELRHCLGLREEASQRLRTVTTVANHLESDQTIKLELAGLVDNSHAALAELAQDLVASNCRPPGIGQVLVGHHDRHGMMQG